MIFFIGLTIKDGLYIFKDSNIELLDYTPPEAEYDYLRPRGTILIETYEKWKVPIIRFYFDGWSENAIRLWPQNNTQREQFLVLQRTSLPSPIPSSKGYVSGYDNAFSS